MPVKGLSQVNTKLKVIADNISKQQLERALYAAATHGAGNASLMTPVHTSNLINSQYVKTEATATGYRARIGYTANYALYVHEASGKLKGQQRPDINGRAQGKFWDPNGEPEFLTKAFTGTYGDEVEQVFYKGMKI